MKYEKATYFNSFNINLFYLIIWFDSVLELEKVGNVCYRFLNISLN